MNTRRDRLEAVGELAELLAPQYGANGVNLLVGERRQIGEGTLVYAFALTIGSRSR